MAIEKKRLKQKLVLEYSHKKPLKNRVSWYSIDGNIMKISKDCLTALARIGHYLISKYSKNQILIEKRGGSRLSMKSINRQLEMSSYFKSNSSEQSHYSRKSTMSLKHKYVKFQNVINAYTSFAKEKSNAGSFSTFNRNFNLILEKVQVMPGFGTKKPKKMCQLYKFKKITKDKCNICTKFDSKIANAETRELKIALEMDKISHQIGSSLSRNVITDRDLLSRVK